MDHGLASDFIEQEGRLDVVSDAICPWCWIGKHQLERALAFVAPEDLRFTVHWRAFQLNPNLPREGVDRLAYRAMKFGSFERAAERDAEVAAAGARVGLSFRHDLIARTPNTLAAHRLIRFADREGVQNAVVEALFRAYFTEGRDIGDPAELAACAASTGLNPHAVEGLLASEEDAAAVLGEDAAARSAGVNGVPSFFLDGRHLFTGALPAERIIEALRQATRIPRAA
jgi:predicted DsbA family dithiol-disulfide isomerase